MGLKSYKVAKIGEQLVRDCLEGSIYPNEIKESFLPYDIEWNGVKINVKTTSKLVVGSRRACTFTLDKSSSWNGVVIVMVALLENEDQPRFWVEKVYMDIKGYRHLKDSIGADELKQTIMNEAAKSYKEVVTGRSKMVHLKELDWFKAQRLAEMLSEERGHKITVVAAIREAVEVYGEKVWNSKKT